jgi:hypothetical protein
VHFSGSAETSSPGKQLSTTKIRKPLTVRKALFGRESVCFQCMDEWKAWQPSSTLMYASVHRRTFLRREHAHRLFEEPRTSVSGHRGRTGASLDLGAMLAGSFDSNLSKMRAFSDRPLTALGLARSGRQPIAIFRKRFFFLEKND